MNMEKELLALLVMHIIGVGLFGKFESESPWWRAILKWSMLLSIVWTVSYLYGHTVALYAILGMTIFSLIVHFAWCYKNGIHPIAATPRRKYFELRGWKWIE